MKQLSLLLALLALLGCRHNIDLKKAAELTAELEQLTTNISPRDTLPLRRIDGILTEILSSGNDALALKAAEICHMDLGNIFQGDDCGLARKYYEYALQLRKQVYAPDTTHVDILRLYHNIGESYRVENDPNLLKALQYYDAADVDAPGAQERVVFNNMLHRGMVLCEIGERERALEDFQRAYRHFFEFQKGATSGQGKKISEVLNGYAVCYRAMRRFKEGLEKAYEGNVVVHKIKVDSTSQSDIEYHRTETADLLLTTGNLWQDSLLVAKSSLEQKAAYDSSVYYTKRAYELYQIGSDNANKLKSIGNLGAVYRRGGHLDLALSVLSAGIQFSDNQHINIASAPLFINLGYLRHHQKKYAEALQNYHTALIRLGAQQWNQDTELPNLSDLKGEKTHIFTLLSNIALTWIDSARLAPNQPSLLIKASATCDSLLAFSDHVRGSLMSDGAKLQLAKSAKDWVHNAFETNMQLYRLAQNAQEQRHYLAQAFRVAEHGKAFALLEAARLRNATNSLPASIQDEEQGILADLSAAENHPDRLSEAERRKRNFFAKLAKEHPQFYNLKYQTANVSPDSIQHKMLAPNQALVEYFCQDSTLYCFLLSASVFRVDTVRITKKQLADEMNQFQRLLENADSSKLSEQDFIRYSSHLYQILLKKLEPGLTNITRLVVIPDAPLNNLSFDALLFKSTPGAIKDQILSENFVVFKYALSYCFSANLLMEMQKHAVPPGLKHQVAAFMRDARRSSEVAGFETKGIGQIMESSTQAFWTACKRFAYAHVAAEGRVDENNPGRSGIEFSRDTLLLNDLYNHQIDQDMIVLSACETARGQYSEGEGNLSLAHGLAYSGVRSFITTLWKIPIDGPAAVMPPFYDSLFVSHHEKDVALAEAKKAYLRDYGFKAPANWAGMVFIGACDMADPSTSGNWLLWGLAPVLLGLGWYGYRILKQPKPGANA